MLCVVVPEFEESLIRITKNFVPPKEWKKPPAEGPFLEEFGLPVSVRVVYLGQCWGACCVTNALPRHDHRALLLRFVPQQSMIDEVKGRSADVDDPLDVDDDDDDMLADMPDLDEIYVDKAAAVAAQRQQEQSVEEDDSDDDMCGVCDEDGELLLCDGCDQGCVELSAAPARVRST